MINTEMVQMLVMSGAVGVVLGSGSAFAFLKKKGVNVPNVIKPAEEGLESLELSIAALKKISPNSAAINIADTIEKWVKIGAKNADQLYYSSQLTNKEDRKTVAKETVYNALKELNITPTENQKKLIDDTIESCVLDLGHNKTEEEKQAQINKLTEENKTLKTTINTITTAASTVQTSEKVANTTT